MIKAHPNIPKSIINRVYCILLINYCILNNRLLLKKHEQINNYFTYYTVEFTYVYATLWRINMYWRNKMIFMDKLYFMIMFDNGYYVVL